MFKSCNNDCTSTAAAICTAAGAPFPIHTTTIQYNTRPLITLPAMTSQPYGNLSISHPSHQGKSNVGDEVRMRARRGVGWPPLYLVDPCSLSPRSHQTTALCPPTSSSSSLIVVPPSPPRIPVGALTASSGLRSNAHNVEGCRWMDGWMGSPLSSSQ